MQLPAERRVEKAGEFKEIPMIRIGTTLSQVPKETIGKGAETRPKGRTLRFTKGKRPLPSEKTSPGNEIVQALKQFRGSCNRKVVGSNPTAGAFVGFRRLVGFEWSDPTTVLAASTLLHQKSESLRG